MKHWSLWLLLGVSLIFGASCGKEPEPQPLPQPVKVTGITLNSSSITLIEGETADLIATISPKNADNQTVLWSSSNGSVANVDGGKVTALNVGSTTITAKSDDGGFTASCSVTVVPKTIEVTSIELSKEALSLVEGESETLIATVMPDNAMDKTVTWISSDVTIVTVNGGIVTAIKEGSATITAKAGDKSATCEVTITNKIIEVESIELSNNTLNLTEGDSEILLATVKPEDATDKTVYWTSSDPSIASVENGTISAITEGVVIIIAKAGGITATCEVTVEKKIIPVESIELSETEISLTEGDSKTLIATVKPEDATVKTVSWTTSDSGVATITNEGKVTAIKQGIATITVTTEDGTYKSSCTIIVTSIPSYFSYLTFTSEGQTILDIENLGGNAPILYYSYDRQSWTKWDYTNQALVFTIDRPLYLYGDNKKGFNKSIDRFSHFVSVGDGFRCSGDVMSLINNTEPIQSIPCDYCFYDLFYETSLTSGPDLPATHLSAYCYSDMFLRCRFLKTAPTLPATVLATGCYEAMFEECSSLILAPELPATTLVARCYSDMFGVCTSLTTAPELPAKSLADYCYESMFWRCSNLKKAPSLPATVLANYCYSHMFQECTLLETAPTLPATSLANHCYSGMFLGCSSLVNTPSLPASKLEKGCYESMFRNCISLAYAPKLPAISLAEGCYSQMFMGCYSLSSAPILPATILVQECYRRMFSGCKMLNRIECLAISIAAKDCLLFWAQDVSSTGQFIKNPAMSTWPLGYSGIPDGWTVIDAE